MGDAGASKKKGPRKMERHFKGVSNHHRIEMLQLIARKNGIALIDIAEETKMNLKTAAEHVRRLQIAGLIEKKYAGRVVEHSLTPYGRHFHAFIETFSRS